MASSQNSLDSLSSPSLSPSPPPQQPSAQLKASTSSTTPASAPFRNLDSDSELSELTDDDQDASAALDRRTPASSAPALSATPPDDDGAPSPTHNNGVRGARQTRQQHQRSSSSRGGGPSRRKRSSIVPAPMWGWAERAPQSSAPVEEEEEEMTGPPRAMEEEEEEEKEVEEDDYPNPAFPGHEEDEDEDFGSYQQRHVNNKAYGKPRGGRASGNASRRQVRKNGDSNEDKLASWPEKRHRPQKRVEDEDEGGPPTTNANDEDYESASASFYPSMKKKRPIRSRAPASNAKKRKSSGADDSDPEQRTHKKKKIPVKSQPPTDAASERSLQDNETEDDLPIPKLTRSSPPPKLTLEPQPVNPATTSFAVDPAANALSTLAAMAESAAIPSASSSSASSASAATEQPPTSAGEAAALRSRSHSPSVKSDAELSAEEFRPVRGRGRGRGRGRTRYRRKVTAHDKVITPNCTSKSPSAKKKAPPPLLDLKLDPVPDDPAPELLIETEDHEVTSHPAEETVLSRSNEEPDLDVDMDPEGPDEDEDPDEDVDDEEQSAIHDEEDDQPIDGDDEAADGDPDIDDDAVDIDEDAAEDNEGEGDEDHDQEQENDHDVIEPEQENEEGEEGEGENEEELPPGEEDAEEVDDHESDLQPAHRAEALDVLATIELKFALLRERVYIEKMDALAWEERLVQTGIHPEMLHLQKELSKRRDRRLELSSRKRSYEVVNATTRRKTDETGVWSWWKVARDELQTEMIAESSRKRRKLERERRVVERSQPLRKIPLPPPIDIHNPPLPLSLRKILKSYPFGNKKLNKSDTNHHHRHHPSARTIAYPEISTLSAMEVAVDLEFLLQNRKTASTYDLHQPQIPQQPHYSQYQAQKNISGGGMPSRPLGIGMPNGGLPPPMGQGSSSSMGPPPQTMMHQHMSQHGMGYDQFEDVGPSYGPGGPPPPRLRDQIAPYQTQGPDGSLSIGPPPPNPRDYQMFSGSGSRLPQSSHPPLTLPVAGGSAHAGHAYPGEHEMSTIGPGGQGAAGHLSNHHYFGQGNVVPGTSSNTHSLPSSSSHITTHHASGNGMNGRRSISPLPALSNGGVPVPGSKSNGNWVGSSIGGFHLGNPSGGKGAEWDSRMMHEEEERERLRERERKKEERERDMQRERDSRDNMERERARREREYQDLERDRQLEHRHLQHLSQHRQPPLPSSSSHSNIPHIHSGPGGPSPPIQGPGVVSHHHHHHRTPHHHHVLHHHHSQPLQHGSTSLPPPGPPGPGVAPIVQSPRPTREYEGRPPHSGPGQPHPTEVIMLSSGKPSQPSLPRDREPLGHWSRKSTEDHHHPPLVDFRDRDRDGTRDRPTKLHLSPRQIPGPAMVPLDETSDRPAATPFVMASTHTMQQVVSSSSSSHVNGLGSTSSPRRPPSWNSPAVEETSSYRDNAPSLPSAPAPPSGYLTPLHDPHDRSPIQGHRYATGQPSSHTGRMSSIGPSAAHHRPPSPIAPTRPRPPPSPSFSTSLSNSHRSPVTSPKMRPLSPIGNGKRPSNSASGYNSSPQHLSGPGRTTTPAIHHPPLSSSTAQLISSLHSTPLSSSAVRGPDRDRIERDRERERHPTSPRLGGPSILPPTRS